MLFHLAPVACLAHLVQVRRLRRFGRLVGALWVRYHLLMREKFAPRRLNQTKQARTVLRAFSQM